MWLVTLICLLGGANLLLKGAISFIPGVTPQHKIIDNLFRFLSGIYFGLGFLMIWVVLHLQQVHDLVYYVGLVITFSGLGRLYSRTKVGTAGKYFDTMMLVEILLGIAIICLQFSI